MLARGHKPLSLHPHSVLFLNGWCIEGELMNSGSTALCALRSLDAACCYADMLCLRRSDSDGWCGPLFFVLGIGHEHRISSIEGNFIILPCNAVPIALKQHQNEVSPLNFIQQIHVITNITLLINCNAFIEGKSYCKFDSNYSSVRILRRTVVVVAREQKNNDTAAAKK